jgi:hypothetical protein
MDKLSEHAIGSAFLILPQTSKDGQFVIGHPHISLHKIMISARDLVRPYGYCKPRLLVHTSL